MQVEQLGPGFFAEVCGVTLADVVESDAAYARVREAFEEHSVLLFRGQAVTDELQAAYSQRFGTLEIAKAASLGEGTPYSILTNIDRPTGAPVPPRPQGGAPRARQSAVAHRQLFQDPAGARLGTVGPRHPTRRR